MSLPDTLPELAIAGYVLLDTSWCKDCPTKLYWFKTPKNHRMPMHLKTTLMVGESRAWTEQSQTRYEPHFATCPGAAKRRKRA